MNTFKVYNLHNIEPVKAQGSWLWDKDGNKYLDMYGGHAVISIGHTHPHYVKRITEQLNKISFYSNSVLISLQEELAEKLGNLSAYTDYQLFLCNSGAEANENAIKLASFVNGRKKVIAFSGSFHGRTSLAVAATDDAKLQAAVNKHAEVLILPFNDAVAFEEHISEEVCAVIAEGIQGVGGVQVANNEFLKLLRKKCDETGALLILDEVQSGCGRSGSYFAHQQAAIKPDIISLAKGIGNGFPVAAIMINPSIRPKTGMLGTTFGGNHLACAAALAVAEVMEQEQLMENAQKIGTYLMQELSKLDGVKEVRGKGLMIGLDLYSASASFRNKLLMEKHVFTGNAANPHTVRILPSLGISIAEANIFLEAFSAVLKEEIIEVK